MLINWIVLWSATWFYREWSFPNLKKEYLKVKMNEKVEDSLHKYFTPIFEHILTISAQQFGYGDIQDWVRCMFCVGCICTSVHISVFICSYKTHFGSQGVKEWMHKAIISSPGTFGWLNLCKKEVCKLYESNVKGVERLGVYRKG